MDMENTRKVFRHIWKYAKSIEAYMKNTPVKKTHKCTYIFQNNLIFSIY